MATNPENLGPLFKLLALKRRERPPPGYFDQFTREVTARLRAGEAEHGSWADEPDEGATWVQKIWALFEAKPMLAGAFGAAVCGMVLVGIVCTQRLEWSSPTVAAAPPQTELALLPPQPVAEADQAASALLVSSTNPVPVGLFDGLGVKAQPVDLLLLSR